MDNKLNVTILSNKHPTHNHRIYSQKNPSAPRQPHESLLLNYIYFMCKEKVNNNKYIISTVEIAQANYIM